MLLGIGVHIRPVCPFDTDRAVTGTMVQRHTRQLWPRIIYLSSLAGDGESAQ